MPSAVRKLFPFGKKKKYSGYQQPTSQRHLQVLQPQLMNHPCSQCSSQSIPQSMQAQMFPLANQIHQQPQIAQSQMQPPQFQQIHNQQQQQQAFLYSSSPQHNNNQSMNNSIMISSMMTQCPYQHCPHQQHPHTSTPVVANHHQQQLNEFQPSQQHFNNAGQLIQMEGNNQDSGNQIFHTINNHQFVQSNSSTPYHSQQQQQPQQQQPQPQPQLQPQQQQYPTNHSHSILPQQNQLGQNHSVPLLASSAILTAPIPQQCQPLNQSHTIPALQPLPHIQCQTIQPQQHQLQKQQFQQHSQHDQRLVHQQHQGQLQSFQSSSQPQLLTQPTYTQTLDQKRQHLESIVHQQLETDSSRYANVQSMRDPEPVYCNDKVDRVPPYRHPPSYHTFMNHKRRNDFESLNGQRLTYHSESLVWKRKKDSNYENLRDAIPPYGNIGIGRQELGYTS